MIGKTKGNLSMKSFVAQDSGLRSGRAWIVPLFVAFALAAGTCSAAGQSIPAKKLSKAVSAADDTAYERIFLTLTAEPATSQAVSWRARLTSNTLEAQIAAAPGGPIKEKDLVTVQATVERVVYGGGQTMLHAAAEFQGLRPGTRYAYRVGDGKTWSEWNQFRTADDKPAPFRFLYIGDQQTDIKSQWSRVIRAALLQAPDARFIANAGDIVTDPWNDRLWYEWYDGAGWIYRIVPSFLTPGNHDLGNKAADTTWRPQFVLPRNGPAGQEELSYYVDYQGVRLLSLNGNAYDDKTQLEWCAKVLSDNPCAWTIVVTHQPLYSSGKNRDSSKRRAVLLPLYDKYGVDLVLQGHDHSYGRTPKIHAGRIVRGEEPGVVYANSVSGPKMYQLNRAAQPFMARMAGNLELFQVVAVDANALSYQAYTADGTLFDSFSLQRTGPRRTRLIDRAPKDGQPHEEDFFVESKAIKEQEIALQDVPAPARTTIGKYAVGGAIGGITRVEKDGQVTYEVSVLKDGKKQEFVVSSSGKYLGEPE
jgi:3',5'-cyclic AMP phosphodiesterase CpdA